MIILVSHNGWDYINKSLDAAIESTKGEIPITIADTHSSDPLYSECAKELAKDRGINYVYCNYTGYELVALKNVYEMFPNEPFYILQHDSINAKRNDSYDKWIEKLNEFDVVSWILFPRAFCEFSYPQEREMTMQWCGTTDYDYGIYANTFAINSGALSKIRDQLLKMNSIDKYGSQAMERAFAVVFKMFGLNVGMLEDEYLTNWNNYHNDGWTYFTKALHEPGKGARQ